MLNVRDLGMIALGAILLFSGLGAMSYYAEHESKQVKKRTENVMEEILKAEGWELVKDGDTYRYSIKKL